MKRILLFTLVAVCLCTVPMMAQRPSRQVEQPSSPPTRPVRPQVVDSIIPLAESNRYKDLLRREEADLKNLYRQNPSQELQFLADTAYCLECWFKADTRFKNKPAELDRYIKLLRSTKTQYQRKTLSIADRQELIRLNQEIERFREQVIVAVDSLGSPRRDCRIMYIMSNSTSVTITVEKGANSSVNLNNVRICLATASAIGACKGSRDCIVAKDSVPSSSCNTADINCLKQTNTGSGKKYVLESGKTAQVDRGSYHVIIAEKVGNTEKALYYTTLDINGPKNMTYKVK